MEADEDGTCCPDDVSARDDGTAAVDHEAASRAAIPRSAAGAEEVLERVEWVIGLGSARIVVAALSVAGQDLDDRGEHLGAN